MCASQNAGNHLRMNKHTIAKNEKSRKQSKDRESVHHKTRKRIYDKVVAEVSETNRKVTRHHYKEVSKKCNNMSKRSLGAINQSINIKR